MFDVPLIDLTSRVFIASERGASGSSTPWGNTFNPTATGGYNKTRVAKACKKIFVKFAGRLQNPESVSQLEAENVVLIFQIGSRAAGFQKACIHRSPRLERGDRFGAMSGTNHGSTLGDERDDRLVMPSDIIDERGTAGRGFGARAQGVDGVRYIRSFTSGERQRLHVK